MTPNDFRLERYFAEHEFTAEYVLCASDPESMTVGDLLALEPGSDAALRALRLGYTEPPGSRALRERIASLHDGLTADDVVVCSGAEEPIHLFAQVLLRPGDHVVVQTPTYQSLYELMRAAGAEVTPWVGPRADGSGWSLDALAASLRPSTRAVVVNTPNNPTGAHFTAAEWSALVALVARHGAHLLADEVYRGLEYDRADRLPAAAEMYERAVSTGALAKRWGLAGLRIGWFATRDAELRRRMLSAKDYTTICNAGPSELLAEIALRHHEEIERRILLTIASNLDHLDALFARHADRFEWTRPRAGTLAFVRLRAGGATAFCADVLRAGGVLLAPSPMFDHGDAHLRFGFGRANAPAAIARLEAVLGAPRPCA